MKLSHYKLKHSIAAVFSIALALTHSATQGEETSLREKLLERASQSKMPAGPKAKMTRHLKEITDSDLVSNALKKGDKAPDFQLKDHLGTKLSLSDYLKEGPVILTWYRGGW